MGKRKREDEDRIRRKIRRLQNRLGHRYSSSSDEGGYHYENEYMSRSPSPGPRPYYEQVDITDSDQSETDRIQSRVTIPPKLSAAGRSPDLYSAPGPSSAPHVAPPAAPAHTVEVTTPTDCSIATTSTVANTCLSADILEALGDPKSKEEVFGKKIPDELSKRWGRILVDGLTKEQKQEALDRALIPDNFRLAKAPVLNSEISLTLSDSVRSRDKLLEKGQNHLGYGIAGLTNLTATLIEGDLDKLEIIKKLSEVSQIFLDLHFESTKTRRKLVTSSLDKKFSTLVLNAKRDVFLFGENLGEKIKATKTAERSGFQIRRSDGATSSSFKRYPQSQGNWRGPPRQYTQRAPRQGGPRNRHQQHHSKRPLQTMDRFPPSSSKPNLKPNKQ